jgi:hypothetical protein
MIGTVNGNAAGIGDLFEHALYGAFGKHPVVRRQCTFGGVQDQRRALDPGVVIRRVDLLEVSQQRQLAVRPCTQIIALPSPFHSAS